ncbi:MAG TPA: DMT family transporter [Thermoplasmata archaeon]|nr:DMT family transporter [Thermoplasmata archaeon]
MRFASGGAIRTVSVESLNLGRSFPGPVDARRRDYVFVVLASVFWGTAFPGTKLIAGPVDPLVITAARLGIGALLGLAVLAGMRRLRWSFLREPWIWGLGLVNSLAFNLQNVGLVYTTVSKTALLVNVNIVFIAILMVFVYKEKTTLARATGIGLGLLGVVVLATKLNADTLGGGDFLGDVLVFMAGVMWAFYVIGLKGMVDRGGDYLALVTMVIATTALWSLLPLPFVRGGWPSGAISWTAIAYLGLVPTFLPMLLYTLSLRTISPTVSSLLVLLEILVATLFAVAMLGEVLDAFTLLGGGLILLGTYVTTRGEQPIPEPGAAGLANVPADPAVVEWGGPRRP